ncbi:MAG TPA: permease-like cell division protein FtsX [Gaiellaceae bacterium]|jgi:cell division transport system permease protein|nr:permease-like cell division protein FtsX [Gaiellaceae bacterium]
MIARLKLIVAEAVRSLGANVSTTFAATTTVLIGMFMLGLVVGLGSWALSLSDHYKKQLVVKVYFCTRLMCKHDATNAQMDAVHNQLIGMKQVKTVRFISKEQAYRIMAKQRPDLVHSAPGNPFPNSFDVVPRHGEQIDAITRQLNPLPAGVQQICPPAAGTKAAESAIGQSCNRITHRVLSVARYLWIVVLIAFIVLLVSSTLLVANTIRLSIFARRREIEVMKLVGATNWFVRGPFMIEGLLCGLGGAIAAIVLLLLGRSLFLGHVIHLHETDVHAWPFGLHVLIVLGAGLLLGALGSGLTIRRFLQV